MYRRQHLFPQLPQRLKLATFTPKSGNTRFRSVHFYAVPESQKLETATQILLTGGGPKDDVRNNTRVTLVGRNSTELVAAMLRIDAAGVNCFSSDDPYIRDGHSFHASVVMSVNVTTAPVCSNIKYSQHVLFLSSTDFRDAMDVITLQHTDVNLVTVLFDESDDDQRSQVSQMLNLLR
ncbi:hypothetical protein AAVH_09590 [Aphelenchoides avenae]|nr:hypothetical protein AAVH_09590 [Aphelenchus avenae]